MKSEEQAPDDVLRARYLVKMAEHERLCKQLDRNRNNVGGRRAMEGYYIYPEAPRPPGVWLLAIHGEARGRFYDVEKRETTIGRAETSDVRVGQDDVSRRHAVIRTNDTRVTIADEGSKQGTYVNGCRIEEVELRHGDLIRIGSAVFKLLLGDIERLWDEHQPAPEQPDDAAAGPGARLDGAWSGGDARDENVAEPASGPGAS